MAPDVATALAKLGDRGNWTGDDDLVFASETGTYSPTPLYGFVTRRRFAARGSPGAALPRPPPYVRHPDDLQGRHPPRPGVDGTRRHPDDDEVSALRPACRGRTAGGRGVQVVKPERPRRVGPLDPSDRNPCAASLLGEEAVRPPPKTQPGWELTCPATTMNLLTQLATPSQLSDGDSRTTVPLFTLRECATYLHTPLSTLHSWAKPKADVPLITTLPSSGQQATVPFVGFAEAFVLGALRKAGVPMQRIRPAVKKLSDEIGLDHALASQRVYTDGAELIFDYAATTDDEQLLTVVRTGQEHFADVVRDYLKPIMYGSDGWAAKVRLPAYTHAEVTVDRLRRSGSLSWFMAELGLKISLTALSRGRIRRYRDRLRGPKRRSRGRNPSCTPAPSLSSSSTAASEDTSSRERFAMPEQSFARWQRSTASESGKGSPTRNGCVTLARTDGWS